MLQVRLLFLHDIQKWSLTKKLAEPVNNNAIVEIDAEFDFFADVQNL